MMCTRKCFTSLDLSRKRISSFSSQAQSTLSYRIFENNPNVPVRKTALIMHGILGNKLNWRTFSQKLATANTNWRYVVLDHRGHGDSPSFTGPHDLKACSQDLMMLVDHLNIQPDAVFGHSFGGKVALQYLLDCERLTRKIPKQVWVLDSLPGTRATDYSKRVLTASIENILPKLKEIPIPIYSKTQLIKDLQGKGIRLEEAQWLTTNLRLINANPETYLWKMDVQVIEKLFQSFLDSDFWPALENPPRGTEIHFVRAEKSKMWSNEIVKKLENLSNKGVHLHYLEKADHWVHIDNPNGLLEIILRYR